MIHTVPHHGSCVIGLRVTPRYTPMDVVPRGTEMFIWVWLGVLWLLICSDYGLHESAR